MLFHASKADACSHRRGSKAVPCIFMATGHTPLTSRSLGHSPRALKIAAGGAKVSHEKYALAARCPHTYARTQGQNYALYRACVEISPRLLKVLSIAKVPERT